MALLRSSFIVGIWTLLSRALGFVRDVLTARALGAVGVPEAFVVAWRFPNLFRRFVAEGAFLVAFVPMYSKKLEREGQEAALRFAGNAMAWLIAILAVFILIAEIFMPAIIAVIAPGFVDRPELFDMCVLFTRLTLPYLLCITVVGLMSGVLNSGYKFAMAAATPALLNIVIILGLLFAVPWFKTAGHMLVWAVVVGGIVQYLWLGYACWKAGLRLRLPWPRRTESTRRLMKLMIPGIIGGGMGQINLLVGQIIVSGIPGALTVLYFADRIYEFPLSMIGIAIGTALLPELSRRIHTDAVAAVSLQNRAVEMALLLALPSTAAIIAIAEPICMAMFQYGRFTVADAQNTAIALAIFATGLPAYVLIRVLVPGFYAREDTRTPMNYALVSLVINTVLSVAFVFPPFGLPSLGFAGIAVATTIAAWANALLLGLGLHRRGHYRMDSQLRHRLPRLALASLLMGGGLVALTLLLWPWVHGPAWERAVSLAILVVFGMALYGALCLALRAANPAELRAMLRRRRSAKAPPAAAPPASE